MSIPTSNTVSSVANRVPPLCLRGQDLTMEEVYAVACGNRTVSVTSDDEVIDKLKAGEDLVREAVDASWRVYGLTTGFGGMANVAIPSEQAEASQVNLLQFLSSGAGKPLDKKHVRAAMLIRANMLLRGASGVRLEIVERLVKFLNGDATPMVCELGSIGASGDLIPLATIARAITGQAASCQVKLGDREVDNGTALDALGLEPLEMVPKEGLAMVNGTSFSAAIGLNCVHSAQNYLALSFVTHTMMTRALLGYEEPFAPFVHEVKPHPGQVWAADMMRRLLDVKKGVESSNGIPTQKHLQDRYSLRCLPQYMGPLVEGVIRVKNTLETEMNSVTDNPLIDIDEKCFLQSGNFLGQYVGIAMDDLRKYLGLMAKHLDVQISQLVTPEFSHGLPGSLVGNTDSPINMGLKGLQIASNSIMPMLTYFGNPLVDHYPTHAEQFNQNVNGLSWGAANLASQSVDYYGHFASISLIFAVQSVDLRAKVASGHYDGRKLLGSMAVPLYEAVYQIAGLTPGEEKPFIYNDGEQVLENLLVELNASIRGEGRIVRSVSSVVDSLGEVELNY